VGYDISFDLALIEQYGVELHAFDPTPLSLNWIRRQTTPSRFNFHPYGIASYDGRAGFHLPTHHGVSFTTLPNIESKMSAEGDVFRFKTILKLLGHDRVSIIKLDIEGAEYDVIPDLLQEFGDAHRPDQLLVEFHHRLLRSQDGLRQTRWALDLIKEAGFSLFYVSPRGLEYSFIKS
jgi:FkbM family methyltransferase